MLDGSYIEVLVSVASSLKGRKVQFHGLQRKCTAQLVTAMKWCKVQHIITSCDSSFWEVHSRYCYLVHFLVPPPQSQQNHLQHSGNTIVNIIENKRADSVAHTAEMQNTQKELPRKLLDNTFISAIPAFMCLFILSHLKSSPCNLKQQSKWLQHCC